MEKTKTNKKSSLLLISILLFSLFTVMIIIVNGTGENWLTGWYYRKSHVINNATGSGSGYQLKYFVFNSSGSDSGNCVYLGSDVLSVDFGDIRFTSDDGSTLLYYWLESYNSTCGIFWVKISGSLETVSQTIYIYYGKISTVTTSNGIDTFNFFDDFSGASINTTLWQGDISYASLSGGIMTLSAISNNYRNLIGKTYFGYSYRVRSNSSFYSKSATYWESRIGFCSGNGGGSAVGNNSGFRIVYTNTTDLAKWSQTTSSVSSTFMDYNNAYHIFEVSRLNGSLICYSSDNGNYQNLTTYIPSMDLAAFFVCFGYTTAPQSIKSDWLTITKFVSPEPVNGVWGIPEIGATPTPTPTLSPTPLPSGYATTEDLDNSNTLIIMILCIFGCGFIALIFVKNEKRKMER